MEQPKKGLSSWYGIVAATVVGGVFGVAAAKDPSFVSGTQVTIAVVAVVGAFVSLLAVLRLRALLIGTSLGIAVGAGSAIELLAQAVAQPFFPVLATVGFFAAIGFIIGGIVEFSLFVHFLAHGGAPSEYPVQEEQRSNGAKEQRT